MMYMPSIFDHFTDDLFDSFFEYPYGTRKTMEDVKPVMETDIKENENAYELQISMPGVKKENITAELKDGYLTIASTVEKNNDEKGEDGKYLRKERYTGSARRSFFVGKDMKQEDIKAKLENGVLTLEIPKQEEKKPEVEEKKYIAIEG